MVVRLFALTHDQRLRSLEIITNTNLSFVFSHIRPIFVDIPLIFIQQVKVDGHRHIVTSFHYSRFSFLTQEVVSFLHSHWVSRCVLSSTYHVRSAVITFPHR